MGAPTSVIVASTPPAATGAERAARAAAQDPSIAAAWGEDGFTFGDLLDLINPLQHLPVISTLYRKFTGDEIAPAARLLGGGLFGGPLGVASAAVGVAVEATTGKDLGEHVLALFDGPEEAPTNAIAWAGPRVGAVALADPEPAPAGGVATAEVTPPPDRRPEGTEQALAASEVGLVPIEPLLAYVALSSGEAAGIDGEPALRDGKGPAPDGYREIGAGAASDRLSAIELARILALYHQNARMIQQSRSAIDSTL